MIESTWSFSEPFSCFKTSLIHFNETFSGNSTKKQTLTIDISKRYQTILGFGGAFTDSTGINIAALPKDLGESIIRGYFSENGLEYTMGRIPIAGSDFSIRPYSYDDVEGDLNLTHWALAEDDLKFKVIHN